MTSDQRDALSRFLGALAIVLAIAVALVLLLPDAQSEHPPHARPAVYGGVPNQTTATASARIQAADAAALGAATTWVVGVEAHQADIERATEAVRVTAVPVEAPAPSATAGSGDPDATLACIRAHESDTAGGYAAVNPSSGAGGAYQALPSTWDGYAGYPTAEDAPAPVQDAWAHEALAAAGTRPWAGSGC